MDETGDKAHEVRRMLSAGHELSYEQRLALMRLRERFDELWERRERAAGRPIEEYSHERARRA